MVCLPLPNSASPNKIPEQKLLRDRKRQCVGQLVAAGITRATQTAQEQVQPSCCDIKNRTIHHECSGTRHSRSSRNSLLRQHLLSSGLYRRRRNSSTTYCWSPSHAV